LELMNLIFSADDALLRTVCVCLCREANEPGVEELHEKKQLV